MAVKHNLKKQMRPGTNEIHPNAPLTKVKNKEALAKEIVALRKKEKLLSMKIEDIQKQIQESSVKVDETTNNELIKFYETIPESQIDPFVNLFWQEQKKALMCKNKGMRWHPMLIKFGIFIRQVSPAVYDIMRNMGILKLPGQSTLRDYTSVIKTSPGFQEHVLLDLKRKALELSETQKYVCLLHDEMSIQQDLVFDKQTNTLIGYVSNEQLDPSKVLSKQKWYF